MPPLLLVEGVNDRHVLGQVLKQNGILFPHQVEIRDHQGNRQLIENLRVTIKARGLDAVGVVIDADADCHARWNSFQYHLNRLGYVLPQQPDKLGTMVEADELPRLGIWIMPNNHLPGKLEDFVQLLVPDGDGLLPLAEKTIAQIPAGLRRFSANDGAKALIHTWLAWQEEPGTRMGEAITKRFLDAGNPAAIAFVHWFRRLADST